MIMERRKETSIASFRPLAWLLVGLWIAILVAILLVWGLRLMGWRVSSWDVICWPILTPSSPIIRVRASAVLSGAQWALNLIQIYHIPDNPPGPLSGMEKENGPQIPPSGGEKRRGPGSTEVDVCVAWGGGRDTRRRRSRSEHLRSRDGFEEVHAGRALLITRRGIVLL